MFSRKTFDLDHLAMLLFGFFLTDHSTVTVPETFSVWLKKRHMNPIASRYNNVVVINNGAKP